MIVLEGKSLMLDSLDIIVNVGRLPAAQDVLFSCIGADLTVRNCTITLVNPANQPFTLVRAEGSAVRGSRIRFDNTLVRGAVSSGFDLGKGTVDVAVRGSVFLGSQGADRPRRGRRLAGGPSVLGGRQRARRSRPGLRLSAGSAGDGPRPRPLVVRSFDTVYGRFQGAGIASVIAADNARAGPSESVDWLGEQNLFCGWKGFFASGEDRTIRIPNLAAFRSTWNGSDGSSAEISSPWPQPTLPVRGLRPTSSSRSPPGTTPRCGGWRDRGPSSRPRRSGRSARRACQDWPSLPQVPVPPTGPWGEPTLRTTRRDERETFPLGKRQAPAAEAVPVDGPAMS